jgi:DNA-binding NarL/FixJ family response regulator
MELPMKTDHSIIKGTAELTEREQQVLTLIETGRTRKEVAFDLGIAHSTVRVLLGRAVRKLHHSGEVRRAL